MGTKRVGVDLNYTIYGVGLDGSAPFLPTDLTDHFTHSISL